jgi:hypothetical protein
MSLRPLALASLALLVSASRIGHADRFQLGLGIEDGSRSETNWFAGVVELDARLTHYLSLRIAGRVGHFDQTADACDFDSSGPALDATGGLRLDFVRADRPADVRPYVAGGVGIAAADVLGACKGSTATWLTSPMLQVAAGVDFQSELPPGYRLRIEARTSFADFSPGAGLAAQFNPTWEYQQLNLEYSLAAMLVIPL